MPLGLEEKDHYKGRDQKAQELEKPGADWARCSPECQPAEDANRDQKKDSQPYKEAGSCEMKLVDSKLHPGGEKSFSAITV